MSVLEPSAGRGALILAALRREPVLDIVAMDIDPDNVQVLHQLFGTSLCGDFLGTDPADFEAFDRVLMNPPFNGGVDTDHLAHAWQFVRPGGLLVAITSGSWRTRKGARFERVRALHEEFGEAEIELGAGAFKAAGTMVGSVLIRWKKPRE